MLRRLGFIGLLVFSCCLHAQEFRSTLAGRVVDQTGAVVVGAKVEAIEMANESRYEPPPMARACILSVAASWGV